MTAPAKITYTTASGDLEEFHQSFDAGLERVRSDAGKTHPFYIGHKPFEGRAVPLVDHSPIDTSFLLGRFAAASAAHVDDAVQAARKAQRDWGQRPWRERMAILHGAATIIRE